jgi:hypothetical protein
MRGAEAVVQIYGIIAISPTIEKNSGWKKRLKNIGVVVY